MVKEDLYAKGIPVAYMQLDDCEWVGAPFLGQRLSPLDSPLLTPPHT